MKHFFTLLLFSALAFVAAAQTQQTLVVNATEPEVIAMKEMEFDFGKIPQGKPATHTFEVINIGKQPFKINNIATSCGCTTPEWEKDKMIEPGKSTKITVGYNAAGEGFFTKTITVTYNDNKTKVLTIKGEVWKTPNQSAPENDAINDLKF